MPAASSPIDRIAARACVGDTGAGTGAGDGGAPCVAPPAGQAPCVAAESSPFCRSAFMSASPCVLCSSSPSSPSSPTSNS
eukprot:13315754-Heterocapsa_arctica.AAC.1